MREVCCGVQLGCQGNYPVGRDDAAQLAALQIQAEMGAAFGGAAEPEDALAVCLDRYFTKQVLLTRPHADWMTDVAQRYKALEQFSKEDARMQVCRHSLADQSTKLPIRRAGERSRRGIALRGRSGWAVRRLLVSPPCTILERVPKKKEIILAEALPLRGGNSANTPPRWQVESGYGTMTRVRIVMAA